MNRRRRVGENEELHLGLESGAARERVRGTMTLALAKSQSRIRGLVVIAALAGAALFQFFGNASRGYVDTTSTYWWWISQWIDPHAETEHGWLVLGLSVWLFWRNLRATPSRVISVEQDSPTPVVAGHVGWGGRDGNGESGLVLVAFGLALALHAIGFIAQQTRISIIALLVFTWALLRMADRRWAAAAAFPLGFLVFAIPLNVLDSVGFWLRLGVIDATAAIARLLRLDVVQSGTQLFAPDGRFQYDVAAACSGVRSLMALSALSLMIGYVNFRTVSRRALMLLLCFPLTYLGNVVRVVVIVIGAHFGGQRWGALMHDLMGYGVFAIVLGGVFGAAAWVRHYWPERNVAQRPAGDRASISDGAPVNPADLEVVRLQRRAIFVSGWTVLVVVCAVAGEMAFLGRVSTSHEGGRAGIRLDPNGVNPVDLPAFIGTEWVGRRTAVTELERQILPADTGFSRRTYVSINDRSHAVFVSIVLSGRDRTSIHRPEICLVGQGWTIERRQLSPADGINLPDRTVLHTSLIEPRTRRELKAVVAYWFVNADGIVATHWQRFVRDAWNRLRHGRVDRWAYILVQADADDGESRALARMKTVLADVLPVVLLPSAQ